MINFNLSITPHPTKIEYLNASSITNLIDCSYCVACKQDGDLSTYDRGNEATAIGNAIHKLNESAELPDFQLDDLQRIWDQLIQHEYEKLIREWGPEVPLYKKWKKYQRKKAVAFNSIRKKFQETLHSQQPGREGRTSLLSSPNEQNSDSDLVFSEDAELDTNDHSSSPPNGEPLIGMEIALKDQDKKIRGRVDVIERTESGNYRVKDLKSGSIEGRIPKAYEQQLLIYAYLLHNEVGEWPEEIGIEDLEGTFHKVNFSEDDVRSIIAEIIDIREQFNTNISSNNPHFESNPKDENCKWCSFKILCEDYWRTVREEWNHKSFLGKIITDPDNSTQLVEIISPPEQAGKRMSLNGALADESEGKDLLAMTNYLSIDNGIISTNWKTIYRFH